MLKKCALQSKMSHGQLSQLAFQGKSSNSHLTMTPDIIGVCATSGEQTRKLLIYVITRSICNTWSCSQNYCGI